MNARIIFYTHYKSLKNTYIILTWLKGKNNDFEKLRSQEQRKTDLW